MSESSSLYRAHDACIEQEVERGMELLRGVPDYATSLIVRAELLMAAHDFTEAESAIREALTLCPNSPRAILLLEALGARSTDRKPILGDLFDEETTTIEAPVVAATLAEVPAPVSQPLPSEQDPESTDDTPGLVSETLARLLIQQEKFAEARKVYIQLARLHPDRYDYFRGRMDELAVKKR